MKSLGAYSWRPAGLTLCPLDPGPGGPASMAVLHRISWGSLARAEGLLLPYPHSCGQLEAECLARAGGLALVPLWVGPCMASSEDGAQVQEQCPKRQDTETASFL